MLVKVLLHFFPGQFGGVVQVVHIVHGPVVKLHVSFVCSSGGAHAHVHLQQLIRTGEAVLLSSGLQVFGDRGNCFIIDLRGLVSGFIGHHVQHRVLMPCLESHVHKVLLPGHIGSHHHLLIQRLGRIQAVIAQIGAVGAGIVIKLHPEAHLQLHIGQLVGTGGGNHLFRIGNHRIVCSIERLMIGQALNDHAKVGSSHRGSGGGSGIQRGFRALGRCSKLRQLTGDAVDHSHRQYRQQQYAGHRGSNHLTDAQIFLLGFLLGLLLCFTTDRTNGVQRFIHLGTAVFTVHNKPLSPISGRNNLRHSITANIKLQPSPEMFTNSQNSQLTLAKCR